MTNLEKDKKNEALICSTGIYTEAIYSKSCISYLHGIDTFDKLLGGRKFAETKYQFIILNYEDFISFALVLEGEYIATFDLAKKEVDDITFVKNQQVEFDTLGIKEGKLSRLTKVMPGVGVVAAAIDGLAGSLKQDKLYVKSVTFPDGVIYTIQLNDFQKSRIVFSTIEGVFLENVNDFLSKSFDFPFTAKFEPKKEENTSCYIATLCYGDINALQVVAFRRHRDNVLMKNVLGKIFVKYYYIISPKLVIYLKHKRKLNNFIKKQILDKIYLKIK